MNIRLRNGRACLINWPQVLSPDDGRLITDFIEVRFHTCPIDSLLTVHQEPELVNYNSVRRLTATDQIYASLEDDLESVLWVFVEAVLRDFAIDSAEQLFHLFMMDQPAYVAQHKKLFLRSAFDDVTFLPEVQWLNDLLYKLCEDKDISSQTFRRYGFDDVSICVEEESPLFSDSEGSTLCASDSESESEGKSTSKRKAEDPELDDDDVHVEKRARWDYVWDSVAVKAGGASPASTVYSPLSPEFLPVLDMSEPWDISI